MQLTNTASEKLEVRKTHCVAGNMSGVQRLDLASASWKRFKLVLRKLF